MLQYRIALFFGAATVAGAFSGLLAFAISHMNGIGGLEAWSWIFLLEGLLTVVVAIISFFWLVDFPDTATFLTPEERTFVMWKKKYDISSVGEEDIFSVRHIRAAFADWQVWIHILIYISIVAPLTGITLFLPFGYSTSISQLLTIPPYICATIVLFVFAHYSDKLKMRSPFILTGLLMYGLELMFVGIGLIFVPIAVFVYKRINAQRDAAERLALERGEKIQYSNQELRELGDRAPNFRYTL
ncbi:MFS general substrate transporter [Rhizopogon vinicolor AM-OR11-026]|uniref:MFS general substrate transporter n=1 Tax=Rhizopogon vinicolor AM-OR11-026 TaxID=1314800 RepID=A0A1B7MIC1_9AGAM|nr:MFS general substrate transporter [Rhizopogon vinicolor AM-OR11-026]